MQVLPAARMLLDFGGSPTPSELSILGAKREPRECQTCRGREELDAGASDAHMRGYAEGREDGRSERIRTEAQIEEALRAGNEARMAAFSEGLFARIDDGLASVHAEIAQATAQLLATFFQERIMQETVDALASELKETLADGAKSRLIVRGPKEWLDLVMPMLPVGETAPAVELQADTAVDVQIIVDQTTVETAIAAWTSRIEADR